MRPPFAVLVEEGEAKGCIVEADPSAQSPAAELADYLEKMSGAKVPVIEPSAERTGFPVFVGGDAAVKLAAEAGVAADPAAWRSLDGEGYLIKGSSDGLLLAGKTELGVFYAVSTFLEKYLGVRWFMDCEVGEVVPRAGTVKIGSVEDAAGPAFRLRWVGRGDWSRRNKMSVGVAADGELKLKWFVHTFTRIIQPQVYYADHPEYFAEIGGRRVEWKGPRSQIQICTSNPEVVRQTVENVIELKKQDPTLSIVSVDPMDTQQFCQCAACTALDEPDVETNRKYTRRLLLFYNAVAESLRKKSAGLMIKSIAYHTYVAPPRDKSLRVDDDVIIQFCRFTCHNHALQDESCPYNKVFNEYIRGWCDICRNVALYEYYFKASWVELPWPIVHMLKADIPYFKKLGCFGVATQYRHNLGSNGLDYYVAAKLLWDPGVDVDALVNDFCERLYGEAAGPMRDYYARLEAAAVESGVHLARQRPYAEIVEFFTPGLLGELEGCLARAERAAAGEAVKKRIEMVRTSLEYAKICAGYLRALNVFRLKHGTPWITSDVLKGAEQVGAPYIPKIEAVLSKGRQMRATGGPKDSYVALMLSPAGVIRAWDRPELGFGEVAKSMQKNDWLKQTGAAPPARRPRPKRFSLWIYGHDFDSDTEKAEHDVFMLTRSGKKVKVGVLAPPGDDGNVTVKGYAIAGLSGEKFLDGKATVIIANRPGDWTGSTVYAVYVMPAAEPLDSEEVTRRIESDLAGVRRSSLGFIEFVPSGAGSSDGRELVAEIELERL